MKDGFGAPEQGGNHNAAWFSEKSEAEHRHARRMRRWLIAALAAALVVAAVLFTLLDDALPQAALPSAAANAADAASFVSPSPTPAPADETEGLFVAFLDVGQGDCVFLQSPSGKTLLVDGGPEDAFPVIEKFLDGRGVIGLDAVIASHLHADHIGGLISVIDTYPVGVFYDPPFDAQSETYYDLLDALNENNVTVLSPLASADSFIDWDSEVEIRILSPYGIDYGRVDDFNDTSYMLRVTYKNTSLLLAGDATQVAERLAIKALPNSYFKADVLKVAHHGSSDATSEKFLDVVNPSVAVISCGLNNQYGHPDQELLDRLNERGIIIYRTDTDGTVSMLLDGTNVRVLK